MTDVSKLISDLRAGLEGVTPAPWWTDGKYSGKEMGCAIIAARIDAGPLPGNPTRGLVAFLPGVINTQARKCERTAAHIARCDPDNIRAVADGYIAQAERIAALEAENKALREALAKQRAWHESEDKALSKSGRTDTDYRWRRCQHIEQIHEIKTVLSDEEYDAAFERINARALGAP